jgi:hypothetical protein
MDTATCVLLASGVWRVLCGLLCAALHIVHVRVCFIVGRQRMVQTHIVTGPPKDDVYPLGFRYMNGCCTAVTHIAVGGCGGQGGGIAAVLTHRWPGCCAG